MDSVSSLRIFKKRNEIEAVVSRLAGEINRDYGEKELAVIGVLCGSFIFMADLVRKLTMPLNIDFVGLSSYGAGQESCGEVKVTKPLRCDVRGRDVLVVEDIADTGFTSSFLMDYLEKFQPASVRLCALLDKPSRRRVALEIDYKGLTVPDEFLIGYGLDCAGRYRNLPDIYVMEGEGDEA